MNILINCQSNFNLNSLKDNKLGGIESLNLMLAINIAKQGFNVTLGTKCKTKISKYKIKNIPINIIKNNPDMFHFDTIISSNDASIFNFFKESKKILWFHNVLQIEKAIRKKQFFPIIRSNPIAIFVSKYLKLKTSKLFFLKKKIIIPNFLLPTFINKKINYDRKPIFIWSVQRDKGLSEVINIWINNIFSINKTAKFHIYGINNLPNKYDYKYLLSKNIIFKGRVTKTTLKRDYNKATAMICLGYDETFCLNALEANACGLPILTLGETALKDYVKHTYNGFIVKNYTDLSNNILKLTVQKKNLHKKLISNSVAMSKKYHIELVLKNWLKIL